jgi:peroxiredoxin
MKALLSLVLIVLPAWAAEIPKKSPIGNKVDNFKLRDYRGAERSLQDFAERKLVVIAFLGSECPMAKLYGPRLAVLAREFEPRDVAFVGINANQQDSITAIGDYARTHGIAFPILKDVGNVVADQLGAVRTPEVFVLDGERIVRYWGRIDDQYGVGFARPRPERRDLAVALEELLSAKTVSQPTTTTPGCLIGRVQHADPKGDITYSKHIAPILQKRCVECHRPGEIAPFALTSYKKAVGWADTIEEVLREGRMPPWHVNPQYGEFVNDCRVPEAEKQLIYTWIKNGTPEGDSRDLPKPAQFVQGWQIPKPDAVITMPKPFQVPAEGDVLYQFIVVDPGFQEDKWVQAAEVRPGCRAVVHHVLVFVQPPGGGGDRHGGFASNWIAAMAPGGRPTIYPEGMAKFVPAGSRFLFQIHYTPNGAVQADQTSVGLVFADPKTVTKEITTEMAANNRFAIPPHEANYRVDATHDIRADSILLDMAPHTHLRGKSFMYEAIYPDGNRETLLDMPHYDFNWQNTYTLVKPKFLPKGTQLHCVAYYDNSKNNKSNPNPEATVKWGDQTWEEMMIGYFTVMLADQDLQKHPRPLAKYVPKPRPQLDPDLKKAAARALNSQQDFDALAAAVHKAVPQVDRVCLTTISLGKLKVEYASYPGAVSRRIANTGFEGISRAYALAYYALNGQFVVHPDLSKAFGVDMKLLNQTFSASAHVPVAFEGKPGTVNFWSKDKEAFPGKETQELLTAIGEAVISRQ